MKNNFLNLVAYDPIAEPCAAKMPQNTGGGNSQTKRATLALPLRYLCAMLLALVLSVGNMWGTCDPGTIFKVVGKDGLTNGDIAKGDAIDLSSYVTVNAGTITAYGKNDGSLAVIDQKAINIVKYADAYFTCTLPTGCSLQEGDVIKYIIYNKNAYLQPATDSDDEDKLTLTKTSNITTEGKMVIPAGHELIGKSTFYLYGSANATKVRSLEISRPATITLDATTNGGSVSTTSLKGVIGDKVGLPHAFKTGKKFKGWYTTADGDVKKNDAYTIAGDITLYAQFEDLPVSGEMFSLTMEDDLKPLEQCTIVSTVSKSTHLLSPVELTRYATISGGSAVLSNSSTNNHAFISNSTASAILNGGNGCLTITLESALQVGDVITTSIASQNIAYTVEATRSTTTNFVKGDDQTLTVTSESPLKGKSVIYLWNGSSSGGALKSITITRPAPHTLSYAISPDHDPAYATVTLGATSLVEGATTTATYSAIDAAYEFDEWQISGTGASLDDASANPVTVTMGSTDAVITLKLKEAVTKYTITYSKGAYGTGDAIPDGKKDAGVDFTLSDDTYSRDGYVQTGWATEDGGAKAYELGGTYSTDADEELFPFWTPTYTVTKGTHEHGDFTISPASLVAGGTVTLDPTPADGYMFSAWEIVKTSDASATGITVTNKQFEMPAYGVTINATFVADTRKKVLYLTTTNEATTIANDKLYAALKDDYKVTIAAPDAQTLTNYDLVVLHESINGKAAAPDDATNRKQAVLDSKTTSVPVLNTKTYFYNSGRWDWGTPNNGQADQRTATLNSGYCNVADHPIFAGVTITAGAVTVLTDGATGNTMQPVEPSSGKEGYLLATTPNKEGSESSYAIQEIPAGGFRGASSGKYILISVSNAGLNNLTADGQKLFQNAAAYLIGSTAWEPINAITSPEVTASPSAAYSAGDNIALTASATGAVATTTYTWYKGATWAAAEEAGAIKAAATAAAGGNTFGVTGCAAGDAGIYWCVISNGTGCDAKASLEVTVSSVSYNIAFVSAHGTAPTATTGVAYTLPELSADGWVHQGWTASIDVTVDAAPVTTGTTIANGKTAIFGADVTFTAVWKQIFAVTFNLNGQSGSIAPQDIIDGEKATKPADPVVIGQEFGGWFTDEECTAGNEFDFNTPITAATPLFAKWTAFDGCTLLVPATSGEALTVGDPISMQTGSKGGSMSVVGTPLSYNAYGLSFESSSSAKAKVTINNEIQEGTVISLTLVANGTSAPRGLHLYTGDGATKIESLGWNSEVVKYTEATFTYTVQSTDVALIGSNEFQLWRNGSVFLKKLTVTNCGDAIIFHNLTSAITPDNDPAYATVTLGASSVREGHTTTATYSAIDAAYEFDEWQISGTGASIADASANPAVITMGTADAVVTLKLKVATPKHTVTFNKMGKGADIASQLVAEGALVSEPSITEPEGWMLEGWYKESTLENKWDFATDVMGNTDIELFANWVADTSIKLINKSTGAINTTNFTTAVAAEADVDGEKGAVFNANRDAISSVSALNEMVQYNVTTTQTKIQLVMYNTSSAEKTIHLFKVAEGDETAEKIEITIDGSSRKTTEYYTFNSDKNRSFYITVSDKKVQILQMRVVESGTALKQFGQAGYSLNLNKGRMFAKNDDSAYPFEGGSIKVSSDYKVLNNSNLATKSYIQFNNAVAGTILKVTRSGGNYYVSQDPEEKGTIYNANAEVELTATGTWYLGSQTSGSAASFTKIEFIAPKCEQPTVVDMENIGLCEGDAFTALTVSASVLDGGTLHYQWYKHPAAGDDEAVGTDAASYTPTADGQYYVVVTNQLADHSDNSKTSNMVTVEHFASAVITTAPLNQRGVKDAEVTLSVAATGKNLSYAWFTCDNEAGDNPVAVVPAATGTSLNVTITEGMSQWYKVVVTSDCGNASATAKVEEFVPATPANVTESIVWDWESSAWPASGQVAFTDQVEDGTDLTPAYELLADANAIVPNNAAFRSDMLYGKGQYVWRSSNKFFQGTAIKFTTEVAGRVRVYYRSTGNNKEVQVTIAGTPAGKNKTSNFQWSDYVDVPVGDVEILCLSTDANKSLTRVQKIEFLALAHRRTAAYSVGELGTICLEDDAIAVGANVYELQGHDENGKMVFEQIESGEIEAGKPYLFQATNASQVSFYKQVNATHADDAGSWKGMYGTFVDKPLYPTTDVDMFYFSGTHIWAVKDFTVASITIPAYRCYVNYAEFMENPVGSSTPLPGRKRMLIGVNGAPAVATGVDQVPSDQVPNTKVLINGQLFILRGEKMYDAKGQLVK